MEESDHKILQQTKSALYFKKCPLKSALKVLCLPKFKMLPTPLWEIIFFIDTLACITPFIVHEVHSKIYQINTKCIF